HVVTFDRKSKSGKLSVLSNLLAEATAAISGGPTSFGFVGVQGVTLKGGATINGSVASDKNIDVSAGGIINGDARPGQGPPLGQVINGDGVINGWQGNLDYPLSPQYPPVSLSEYVGDPLPNAVNRVLTLDLGTNN